MTTYKLYPHNQQSIHANSLLVDPTLFVYSWEDFVKSDPSTEKAYYIWENDLLNNMSNFTIEAEKLDYVVKNDVKIIIDISTGAINIRLYPKIIQFINSIATKYKNIFILVNTQFELDHLASLFTKPIVPNIIYTGRNEILFLSDVRGTILPKRFLFLCRRWTVDRFFIFLDLRRRKILDNSAYTFSLSNNPYSLPVQPDQTEEELDGALESFVLQYGNNNPYARSILDYWHSEKNIILNDIPRQLGNNIYNQHNIDITNAFSSTYMSLCVETAILDDDMHFQPSEKIYKCCYYRHPFVVYSTPKFLNAWNRSNYKSFSSILNEDYDNQFNMLKRIELINDQVQLLNEMPFEKFRDLTTWRCAKEINHNQIEITKKFANLSEKNYSTELMLENIFASTPLYYNHSN